MISCCIFDLDGVIVDTAKYHFLAWRRLADELSIAFSESDNEALKGVSRADSLNLILKLGNKTLPHAEFELCLAKKNRWYLEYIDTLDRSEILPGIEDFIAQQKKGGLKIALGSASKNAVLILKKVDLYDLFDAVVDGTNVSKAKPDPEVFLRAAALVDVDPKQCIVFEDAEAGVQAALNAGMRVVGIGDEHTLSAAHCVVANLQTFTFDELENTAA